MRWILPILWMTAACSDYNIHDKSYGEGRYNPPNLAAEVVTDRIVQVTIPSVDVLWVIDDSCSMSEEQSALTANFSAFMSYFTDSGLDYHVGVTSMDMDGTAPGRQGKLRMDGGTSYIDTSYDAASAIASFTNRANMCQGTSCMGSGTERGIDATWGALVTHVNGVNNGFYRQDAALSVIVISDEDDYSYLVNMFEFISWLQNLKLDGDMVSFSSIVGPQPLAGCTAAYEPGARYLQVTQAVGGIEWSICASDWSQMLTELGLQAAGLKREFFLSAVPVESTIDVEVHTPEGDVVDDQPFTYSRSRNSIQFEAFVPDPLSEVLITYEVLASVPASDGTDESDTGE
jgi:hypothetical protein